MASILIVQYGCFISPSGMSVIVDMYNENISICRITNGKACKLKYL